jgi:hypothetical protein
MATIAHTLDEIIKIQKEFKIIEDTTYIVSELHNLTSIIYFEYLAHAVLDSARNVDLSQIKGAKEYYSYYGTEGLLTEYIRINNIGQFLVVWNVYEKYLRTKHKNLPQKEHENKKSKNIPNKIKTIFIHELLPQLKLDDSKQIMEEFEVMRLTRNSLHDGGIYQGKPSSGKICNEKFEFNPNQPVKPIRIMNVIQTIWKHYKIFENIHNI